MPEAAEAILVSIRYPGGIPWHPEDYREATLDCLGVPCFFRVEGSIVETGLA